MTPERRPLRVAFFGHAAGRRGDGLSTYSREMVRALVATGAEVRFFAHREDGDILPVEGDAVLLRAWRFKTVTVPRAGSRRRIGGELAAFAPDVVHISWSFSLQDARICRAAHRLGAASVATFHLPHGPARTFRAAILHGLYRYQRTRMRDVDQCIALSQEQRRLLVQVGYPPARVTVIPNGVDTDAVRPGPSNVREEVGAQRVLLYMGRLDPEKRVVELVRSFLSLGLPDDHVLCIAGDGTQRRVLTRLAAGRRNVRLLGLVAADRALELLRGCDVFVLPSTAEGLALSLLEAMAAGCTIVATDAGEDGRALAGVGVVIPVHPLRPALDDALRVTLSDAALRARLGALARHRAVQSYGLGDNARQVLAVYDAAMGAAAGAYGRVTPAALP